MVGPEGSAVSLPVSESLFTSHPVTGVDNLPALQVCHLSDDVYHNTYFILGGKD